MESADVTDDRAARNTDGRSAVAPVVPVIVLLGIAATAWAGSGCSDVVQARGLAYAQESPEAAVREVLSAIEADSERGLRQLLVTREEHETLLWPHLPERNTLSFGYVRKLNRHNTGEAITSALRKWGGAELELIRVEFTREPERYEEFTLHRGTRVWVRRASDGEVGYIDVLDVLVEWNGRWKPMNYAE